MEIGERRGAQTDKVRARVRERERERERERATVILHAFLSLIHTARGGGQRLERITVNPQVT